MWVCGNKCEDWTMPLCVACVAGVLGLQGKVSHHTTMLQDGTVYDGPPSEGGNVLGELHDFEGFSCLSGGKSFTPGDPIPCPKCGQPLAWKEPAPKPKPKGKKKHALVVPTTQDMKAAQYISKYMESHGYPPTIREIMVACEYSSSSAAFRGRERLVAAGIIKVVKGAARGIKGSGLHPSQAMLGEFKGPIFEFKELMESWQEAIENETITPTSKSTCLIVPEKAYKPGQGAWEILWFKDPTAALAFEKDVLESK